MLELTTQHTSQVVEDNLDSLTMDLQLPESLELRPVQGEELLCSRYLTDIKLKLHQPAETLVINPEQNMVAGGDRRQTPQKAGAQRGEPPEDGPRKRTPESPSPVAGPDSVPGLGPDSVPGLGPDSVPGLGPNSVPGQGGAALRQSQLGPATRPSIRQSGDQFIRNPDERPIKPAAKTGDPFQ